LLSKSRKSIIVLILFLAIISFAPSINLPEDRQTTRAEKYCYKGMFSELSGSGVHGRNDNKDDGVICFAGTSDQHYGWKDNPIPPHDKDTIADWMYHPDLPQLDFVVSSFGDWISDGRALGEWEDVKYCWQEITQNNADHQKTPYFFVIGNHDITNYDHMPDDGNPVLKERLGRAISGLNENNYAFLYDNVLFVCAAQTNVLYHLSDFQKNWIEYLTDRYHDITTVIWSHQATYQTTGKGDIRSTSWTGNDYRVHNDVAWWRHLLDDNPQIKLYIHGHTEKAHNTIAFDLHPESWDNNCIFVLVPSNGYSYGQQYPWSYIFTIADSYIRVALWDSESHSYRTDGDAGVPYVQNGSFNVTRSGLEWFSIPKQVLDGQKWTWENRMVAARYKLELIGSNVTEQIDNPELDGCHESDENQGTQKGGFWYAVRGDEDALNKDTGEEDGFIMITGDHTLRLAASGAKKKCIEGKIPYNTAIAVPGKMYQFSARLKTVAGPGSVDFLVSIPKYLTLHDYVWQNHLIHANFSVGDVFETFSETFTVPDNEHAWFIQPKIRFDHPDITYVLDSWSLKMVGDSDVTENFSVAFNDEVFKVEGPLEHHAYSIFRLSNTIMDNAMEFNCSLQGNRVGILRLIYERPQLWSDDVSIGIENDEQTMVYLKDVSPYNRRTSIMSFNGAEFYVSDSKFYNESIRNKNIYFHDACDSSINGYYSLTYLPSSLSPALIP